MGTRVQLTAPAAWFGGVALAILLPAAFVVAGSRTEAPSGAAVPLGAPVVSCDGVPLPTLGGLFGQVVATNQRGLAVGTATDRTGASFAVLWRSGRVRQLSTGTAGSLAVGVNGRGDVVGTGGSAAGPVGWVWSQGVTVRLAADPDEVADPAAINDRGVVVGALAPGHDESGGSEHAPGHHENGGSEEAQGHNEDEQAVVWPSASARPAVLPPLPGDQGGRALAVDNGGRIGGFSAGARFRPVVWDAGRAPRALADLGGGYAAVRALTDSGLAVGDAVSADGIDHPVVWDRSGRITRLDLPAGARSGQALAMLPDGTVVGTADVPLAAGGVRSQAVRWARGAPALLSTADGRAGSVVGAADGTTYAGYLADPVGGRHPVLLRCGR
jgi:uncharacterized membrane protein